MNNAEFNNLFKSVFYKDFFITENDYDDKKLMDFDLNSTLNSKSEFIFFISVIILSKQLIKLNNISLSERNKGKYSLKEFCSDVLNLEFSKSAYTSKKSIVGRVTSYILSMDNDVFIKYSSEVINKIEIKIREDIQLEEKTTANKRSKTNKIKLSDINEIL